jgi:hypothetical protein
VGDESPIHSRRRLTRSKVVARKAPETHVASSPYINPESARKVITHRRNRSKVEAAGSQLEYLAGARVEDYLELLIPPVTDA